jgi:O-antigen ligase
VSAVAHKPVSPYAAAEWSATMTPAGRFDRFRLRELRQIADWLAVAVAVSLPWSTSATSILIGLWLIAILPTLSFEMLRREATTPAGGLPVALWVFAAFGLFWADVSWSERFGGFDSYHRLLVIPVLLAQFRRSDNGAYVLYGYLVSATCLLLTSWAFAIIPAFWSYGKFYGVPVKDYILQSDEFLICGFALLGIAGEFATRHKRRIAAMLLALGALFLANLAFVFTSRTSLVVAPFLIAALGWRLSGLKGLLVACAIAVVIAPVLWFGSPHLRDFALQSVADLRGYFTANAVTSSGLHFEFLRKSVEIVEAAPIFGHGTGSIAEEFRRFATGNSGATAVVSINPHNQIFAVAIQIGCIGALILAAMWVTHLVLFCGVERVAWIGMVVVIENIVSSTANSHLFDFSQGWLYVFGVGVAGGIVLKKKDAGRETSAG